MWRDAALVAGKDLRIELRSRVVMHQVAPLAVLVLVLFAFALGPDRAPMAQAAPGLFWVAVLFATVLAVQRSFALESADGARDGLRLSGLDPAGVFLGKTAAVARAAGRPRGGPDRRRGAALRRARPFLRVDRRRRPRRDGRAGRRRHPLRRPRRRAAGPRDAAAVPLPAGGRPGPAGRDPGLAGRPGDRQPASAGDPWLRLLLVFAAVYLALGVVIFGPLQEAS